MVVIGAVMPPDMGQCSIEFDCVECGEMMATDVEAGRDGVWKTTLAFCPSCGVEHRVSGGNEAPDA